MRTGVATPLCPVRANLVAAEMARATAVLVTLAASASVATAIEGAVIPESIVGAVDGLPGRSAPDAPYQDGVMETLTRVTAGATKWCPCMVRRSPRFSHHCKQGGNRGSQTAERPTSRDMLRQRPDHDVKSMVVHGDPLQRSTLHSSQVLGQTSPDASYSVRRT